MFCFISEREDGEGIANTLSSIFISATSLLQRGSLCSQIVHLKIRDGASHFSTPVAGVDEPVGSCGMHFLNGADS